jgi:L-ascorbate metabolism protein UlaG (beta-lactamase superfamily)
MPRIDVVLISHNHYDHLDEPTIRLLGDGPEYIVPPGLGGWFHRRGCTKVRELPWWEGALVGDMRITATPCLHWSKRTPFDRNHSHWNGYAIEAGMLKVLFIGDSGYYGGFKQIGERLGPFHVAALPIGAYDPPAIMQNVHMTPEEAVQAAVDVQTTVLVPTHYGCFPLTDEEVTEPPRRVFKAWCARDLDPDHLWLLAPGEFRSLEDMIYIPAVRSIDVSAIPMADRPLIQPTSELAAVEWSIAICPHKGDMVDVRAVGERLPLYEADGIRTLSLNHLRCSAYGELSECQSGACPLRDPAFLRSHDLHGIRHEDGSHEPFVEMDLPPGPRWWKDDLRILKYEDP